MKVFVFVLALVGILLHQIATATSYPVLYVSPNGLTAWPCGTDSSQPCKSIATAVAHANDYATTTIKVAQGDYLEKSYIVSSLPPSSASEQLAIEGGWNTDFTVQSHDPALTRVAPSVSDKAIISINIGALGHVDLRLAYLTFHGTSDLHRKGLEVRSSNANVVLDVEHCHISSFTGKAVDLNADVISMMTVTLHDSIIQGNQPPQGDNGQQGAGVFVRSVGDSSVGITMTNNKIVNNHSSGGGGIFFSADGGVLNATLENNILAENNANGSGGAMWATAQGDSDSAMVLTLTNNTISNNHAPALGDGIYFISIGDAKVTAYLKNTIIQGNGTDIHMTQIDPSTLSVTADYSIIGDVHNEGGTYVNKSRNLNVDPLLNKTYHLSSASPAIDKGICGIQGVFYSRIAPYDDIDGDARPGNGESFGCDIGADEYNKFSWIPFYPAFIRKH